MRKTIGPFEELQGLPVLAIAGIQEGELRDAAWASGDHDDEMIDRMHLVNQALANAGCKCQPGPRDTQNNPLDRLTWADSQGNQNRAERDAFWGRDISEMVWNILPHKAKFLEIVDGIEVVVERTVFELLDRLTVEIDEYDDLCTWKHKWEVVL